jgi:hypothetical protein
MMGGFLAMLRGKSNGKVIDRAQFCRNLPETVTLPGTVRSEAPYFYQFCSAIGVARWQTLCITANRANQIMHN